MRACTIVRAWAALVFAGSIATPYAADARPEFLLSFTDEYPAVVGTRLESCNVCHIIPPRFNDYGDDFSLSGRNFAAIESIDSDGDGFENLAEITALTFPGNPLDYPGAPPTPTATPTPTNASSPTSTTSTTSTTVPTPTIPLDACYGDCNENGVVAINELVTAVNIALGSAAVEACPKADRNGDGTVAINELVTAVRAALEGCPDV